MIRDAQDNPMTGATAEAAAAYDAAVRGLALMRLDAVEAADALRLTAPGMVMAHVLDATLGLMGNEPASMPQLRRGLDCALALEDGASERERLHMAALGRWLARDLRGAARLYSHLTHLYPRDLLAHLACHQAAFFTGRTRALADGPGRALPHWPADCPGRSFLMGQHAFGLEENGCYVEAEIAGRAAAEAEPEDVWAIHAVAHVMEMQDRRAEGAAFLQARSADWSGANMLRVHNFWHLALFHLGAGDTARALALYDAHLTPGDAASTLDLVDASAMLWRLHLRGIDVGQRAQAVAAGWDRCLGQPGGTGHYVFNDLHAAFARAMAGRLADLDRSIAALAARAAEPDREAAVIATVGLPLARAISAFAHGAMAEAADLIGATMAEAVRAGGSHAQRAIWAETRAAARARTGLPGRASAARQAA